jgi:arginyl-tRNA synthetase
MDVENIDVSLLSAQEELDLISLLASFPEEISEAAKTTDPSRITRYTIDLASAFHKFYNAQRVKIEDKALMNARILLCNCVKIVIHNALTLLKITAPERM